MPTRVHPARPGDPARIGPYRIIGRLGSGGMGLDEMEERAADALDALDGTDPIPHSYSRAAASGTPNSRPPDTGCWTPPGSRSHR
ncbi:hypothetical protein [Streptomyces sp. LN245]|uniref:hypothetical protein n=1 Tax=Streptomyces sp. LN245 TaxID=3112975 RepID=UPI003711B2AC